MKLGLSFLVFLIVLGVLTGIYFKVNPSSSQNTRINSLNQTPLTDNINAPVTAVVAQNLEVPWAIAFLPNGEMLVTERPGRVQLVSSQNSNTTMVANLPNVKQIGEGGLLGIALDPDFESNNYVYLYYTYDGSGNNTKNRVVRMTFENGRLENEEILVDAIPGASNHNGGRIKFGPDGYLYIATGDAQEPSLAQNKNSLAGKILRVTPDGKAAPGNPFGNRVYSYGHRNVQGLAWDANENLWATEHGRSGVQSGLDELNLIKPGNNYGWDIIQGDETRNGMVTAVKNSGGTTWAPANTEVLGNDLYFVGLRGKSLYKTPIQGTSLGEVQEYLVNEFGRLREVVLGPDGMLYITTSNRDGRGSQQDQDDKIIRVNTAKL